ncbi:hypothetical protein BSKO_08947 [Bryopsis sp. KO-2023]|nr:hypothetical protein BSKO_08947 [Bryopsis sp. KO-2023]
MPKTFEEMVEETRGKNKEIEKRFFGSVPLSEKPSRRTLKRKSKRTLAPLPPPRATRSTLTAHFSSLDAVSPFPTVVPPPSTSTPSNSSLPATSTATSLVDGEEGDREEGDDAKCLEGEERVEKKQNKLVCAMCRDFSKELGKHQGGCGVTFKEVQEKFGPHLDQFLTKAIEKITFLEKEKRFDFVIKKLKIHFYNVRKVALKHNRAGALPRGRPRQKI